jgi:hypothetical protein
MSSPKSYSFYIFEDSIIKKFNILFPLFSVICNVYLFNFWDEGNKLEIVNQREALARFGYRPHMNIIFLWILFIFWLPARTHWGNLAILYLSMKEGSLFCFVVMRSTKPGWMLQIVFLVSLESSWRGGVHGLGSMKFGLGDGKVLEYWMISSLKIKLN